MHNMPPERKAINLTLIFYNAFIMIYVTIVIIYSDIHSFNRHHDINHKYYQSGQLCS